MILPSIDLAGGRVVQLRRGTEHVFTDPRPALEVARELSRFGTLAVVDLDAARGRGDNRAIVRSICRQVPCRVGGGIRTTDDVRAWIKAGAEQVMIGTAASPEFLRQLPRQWLIACVDSRGTDVVVDGWTSPTGHETVARAVALAPFCSGLLFTQVQREGMLAGPDLDTARRLRAAVDVPLTVAGGVRSIADLRALLDLGASAQIGMALYTGQLDLTAAWCELVRFDLHELLPTVVVDADDGRVRMQAWSSRRSLERTLRTGAAWFESRTRGLWEKGATSGNRQQLVGARWDCDRDCLLFRVRQQGPTCHRGTATCFDGDAPVLDACRELERTIDARAGAPDAASYTRALLADPALVAAKLREEVEEVIAAQKPGHVAWECADVVYHLMVRMRAAGVPWLEVEAELRSRQHGPHREPAARHQA